MSHVKDKRHNGFDSSPFVLIFPPFLLFPLLLNSDSFCCLVRFMLGACKELLTTMMLLSLPSRLLSETSEVNGSRST